MAYPSTRGDSLADSLAEIDRVIDGAIHKLSQFEKFAAAYRRSKNRETANVTHIEIHPGVWIPRKRSLREIAEEVKETVSTLKDICDSQK